MLLVLCRVMEVTEPQIRLRGVDVGRCANLDAFLNVLCSCLSGLITSFLSEVL
jgi:hypothetical protein